MLDYSFNYLDVILAIPILIFFIKGFNKGFKNEINGFIGLLSGLYVTLNFSSLLYPKLSELLVGYEILIPISSIIILFIVMLFLDLPMANTKYFDQKSNSRDRQQKIFWRSLKSGWFY